MNKKLIIEMRINENRMRTDNPNIPYVRDEIVETVLACREAGASIVHFHGRHADGSLDDRLETYADVIGAIHKHSDMLVLPTLGYLGNEKEGKGRLDGVIELAKNPLTKPDIIPLDTGTTNIDHYNAATKTFTDTEVVYHNTTDFLLYGAQKLTELGIKTKLVCWDSGFVRRATAMLESGATPAPGYYLLHLTGNDMITGAPCTRLGLDCMLSCLPQSLPHEYVVTFKEGNVMPLAPYIIEKGGNVSIGIGDYPHRELGTPTNRDMVERIRKIGEEFGRSAATPAETREMLGMPPRG